MGRIFYLYFMNYGKRATNMDVHRYLQRLCHLDIANRGQMLNFEIISTEERLIELDAGIRHAKALLAEIETELREESIKQLVLVRDRIQALEAHSLRTHTRARMLRVQALQLDKAYYNGVSRLTA